MARKQSASARPRTGNQRNPLLHRAIIAAANEVLAKVGPTRFTIEAVAKLAGCGKPTIYRWWPSRSALLLEVFDQAVEHELLPPKGMDLAKDLAVMLRQIWRLWRQDSMGSLYRLILSEMMLEKELSSLGISIERNTKLTKLSQGSDSVTAYIEGPSEKVETFVFGKS